MQAEKSGRNYKWVIIFTIVLSSFMFVVKSDATDEPDKKKSKTEVSKTDKQTVKNSYNHAKVAVVNDTVITQSALDRDLLGIRKRFAASGKKLQESQLPEIKKDVLENLINRTLLFQESVKQGIKIDDTLIKEQLAEMKKRYDNPTDFEKKLEEANLTVNNLEYQIKLGMSVQQLIDKKFVQTTTISSEEAKTYYDANLQRFSQPAQVKASHILIKVDPKADEAKIREAKEKIEKIQKRVKKGDDFAALAKEFSEGPSAPKGGDLGYFGPGRMVKPFETAAFEMKPDEVSDIVKTRFGYHLIKVIDKKPTKQFAFEEVQDKLKQFLKEQKVQKEVETYLKQLKESAKIERFLK
ncbi:peptidylprolyl isomerase [Desulfococcaceae bacterium HSG9]|nr:peptidylprolyl isomerase [Desulfococcaceae bacterium HSG9]